MRKLIIEEIKDGEGNVTHIKIIEQSHRRSNFSRNGDTFRASNGLELASSGCPEAQSYRLYVRGDNKSKDDIELVVRSQEWLEHVRQAIKEYHDFNNDCNICIERKCNSCLRETTNEKTCY
jgi:hypothetical protein